MSKTVQVFRNPVGAPVAVPEDVVLAADRPYRAYNHYLGGMPWEAVADLEQYPNVKAAQADVRRYLDEGRSLVTEFNRQQLLERTLAKLNLLQNAAWKAAMEGNLSAINTAHSIVLSEAKLLRLDQDIRDEGKTFEGRTVVTVPDDDEGYSRTLEAASMVRGPA